MSPGAGSGGTPPADPAGEALRRWQHEGDLDALDTLLRSEIAHLKELIARRTRGLLGETLGASDLAQETLLRLLEARTAPRFDDVRALRRYLWLTAWRLLIQRMRQRGRRPRRLRAEGSQELSRVLATTGGAGAAEAAERTVALELAVNLLPPPDRDLLIAVYTDGLDIPSAAARLGLTTGAANMRLVRARRALASRLAAWGELLG